MTLVRLIDGKFLAIDAVDPCGDARGQQHKGEIKEEIDRLTLGGTLLEGVLATHPFHTLGFEPFFKVYGKTEQLRSSAGGGAAEAAEDGDRSHLMGIQWYGTPRHLRRLPSIPWHGDSGDASVHGIWKSRGVEMRLPPGK